MLHTVQTVKPTEALRFVIFDYIYIQIDVKWVVTSRHH